MSNTQTPKDNEVPTLLIRDSNENKLLCFLEQIVPIDNVEYLLLTPVDTPVSLFKLVENEDPELIKTIENKEKILEVADIVLQEYELKLIRSAVTLTITGDLEEPEPEELEEKDFDEDSELYEQLGVNFKFNEEEYGLFIPLDPFFIVGKIFEGNAVVLEGNEFDTIQPLIESEIEKRDF